MTVTDSEGVQKTLKIDEFVVTDPNSQTGQILLELETSLGGSSSSRVQSSRTAESQRMSIRSVESGASARSNTLTAAQVRLLILAGAKTVQESNLLNSSDMTLAMPVIIEGTMKKMSKIGLSGEDTSILVSSLIVGSLMKSIDKRKTHLDSSTTDSQQTPLQTLMSRMSKMTIKNLRSAGISPEKIMNASSTLVSTMIQNLDEAGLGADDISTAVESISSGSIGSLGEIEGIDNSQLQESIVGITSKASESLKNTGLPSSSLSGVVEKITKGAVKGLGNIKNQNSDLSSMMEKVTEGAVKGLGKLKTGGMNEADIQSMIQKATLGAVKAIEEYPNEMVALIEKVTAGATKGLNELDISEISSLIEQITTGATEGIGELKNSKIVNVTDEQFGTLIEKSTGGAVKQLSSLNLDSSVIDGFVSKARNGASNVLEKMADTNSSFDLENMKKNIDNGANTAMTSQGWTYVTKVSSSSSDTWISQPNPIDIHIEFNGNVTVTGTGTPKLELSFYNGVKLAEYNSGNNTKKLTFRYDLNNGDESTQLSYLNSTSLKLHGGEIKSTAGKSALLVLPAPGTPMSLSGLLPKNECSGKRIIKRNGSDRCLRNDVRIDLQKPQNTFFKVTSEVNPATNPNIVVDFGATDGTGIQYYLITQSNEISSSAHWTELRPPVTSLGHFSVNYDLRRPGTAPDGEYNLYVHFRDEVGNISTQNLPPFKLDTTGPLGDLILNDNYSFTNSNNIFFRILAEDDHEIKSYAISESIEKPDIFSDFQNQALEVDFSKEFTLSNTLGNKTIHLWLKDRAGNESGPIIKTIMLDKINPTASISYSSAGPYKAGDDVVLNVSFSETMADGPLESTTSRSPHRYWRIRSITPKSVWNIKELEFLDSDEQYNPNLDTIAQPRSTAMHQGVSCIQSGQYGSHGCNRAYDNNYDSWWSNWASGYETYPWIGVDFGSNPKDIVHVRVMPGRPAAADKEVVVEWSDDKSKWTEWSGNRITTRSKSQSQSSGSRTNTWDELVVKTPTLNPKISFSGIMNKSQIEMEKIAGNSYRYQFTAPLGDGSVSVQLHGQDPAGNPINQNPTSGGTWILDNTKPNGSVLIQSGNANSNNRRVGLQLQGTDTNGITGFLISESNQQNPNGFTSVSSASNFSKNLNHDLTSSGDGTKTIYAWYRDHAGNIGGPFTDTIDLDTTKPILSFDTDGSPPSYTNASSIKLNIQLTETSQVSLSGKCGDQTYINQSSGELDLGSLSEGNYDDCVLNALDNAGNPSAGLAIPGSPVQPMDFLRCLGRSERSHHSSLQKDCPNPIHQTIG